MLKEAKKTKALLLLFLSLGALQLGEGRAFCHPPPPPPLGYAYDEVVGA